MFPAKLSKTFFFRYSILYSIFVDLKTLDLLVGDNSI